MASAPVSPSASPNPTTQHNPTTQYKFDGQPVTVGHTYVSMDGHRYIELNPQRGQGIGETGRYLGFVREDHPSLTKESA